ncbi:fatty acid desaturase family protein [Reyranella sp. CPCC 100927]|uniref:fatty acid desaturase family protein n=1 Tax=Reyranella sp. CPCC 100927 TaxID=2599616 RepID=UPI0011B546A8|nr:fatty acid desaturase family protein [Reyranella sp. CPCC 100927]TWT10071.1 fatty acid desaturase [Reyranella sp. CPCC 100927]
MLAKPTDYLTADEIRVLRRKSDLVGALLVLHAWGLIFGAMALFVWWPNPLTFVLAVMVIGTRQLGIAILMHDAAHGLLFDSRRLNDWAGVWLCGAPVGASMALYRPYHLTHHRRTQQDDDPDLGLSAPFPITRASLRRKVVRDLLGQTAYQRRGEQIRRALGPRTQPLVVRLAGLLRGERDFFITNAVLFAGLALVGYWWLYPALWLLPLATWYQLVSRIRNIAEHAVVPDNDDPLRNTRTTYANPIERLFVAPYWVNYHLEHHMFLFVPCWRLPAAHRLLLAKGYGPQMELRRGYHDVLRRATSKLIDGPRDAARPRGTQHI